MYSLVFSSSKTSVLVLQVLVIFSDGLDDDVMRLEYESERLRQSGDGVSPPCDCANGTFLF